MRVLEYTLQGEPVAPHVFPDAELVWIDPLNEEATYNCDPREIPEDAGEFDIIVLYHILQYIPRGNILPMLINLRDHLSEEGKLHVLVPDFLWILEYLEQEGDVDEAILIQVYGEQHHPWQYINMSFTMPLLRAAMERCGYKILSARAGPDLIELPTREGEPRKGVIGRKLQIIGESNGRPIDR